MSDDTTDSKNELGNGAPNQPMKLTVAFGARSLSASRWADDRK